MNRVEFTIKIATFICKMANEGIILVGDRWQCSREEQNRLYKIGRAFANGVWEIVGDVVTFVDGIIKLSKHQSATALDLYPCAPEGKIVFDVLAKGNEKYKEQMLYAHSVWDKEFGGKAMIDKPNFRDFPHFEG